MKIVIIDGQGAAWAAFLLKKIKESRYPGG